jgi:hypothetical protein
VTTVTLPSGNGYMATRRFDCGGRLTTVENSKAGSVLLKRPGFRRGSFSRQPGSGCDSRGLVGDIGLPLARTRPDGTFGYIPVWSRLASDYLAAALPAGLQVRRCEELRRETPLVDAEGRDLHAPDTPEHRPGRPPDIWALHRFAPEATNAAYHRRPHAIVWHFLSWRGRELRIGDNFRLAPFGNRRGQRYGSIPHYHRRGAIDPATGEARPGQGIGRNRPWEKSRHDTRLLDRF